MRSAALPSSRWNACSGIPRSSCASAADAAAGIVGSESDVLVEREHRGGTARQLAEVARAPAAPRTARRRTLAGEQQSQAGRARSRFAISSAASVGDPFLVGEDERRRHGVHRRTLDDVRISADRGRGADPPLATDSRATRLGACPAASMKPLLVARGVTKRFGAVEALVDVDFDVDAGEVVALVGDNGAGKSTLIKAIAGVQPADAGEYWIDGRKVRIRTPSDAHARRHRDRLPGPRAVRQPRRRRQPLPRLRARRAGPGAAQALAGRDRHGAAHARAARPRSR